MKGLLIAMLWAAPLMVGYGAYEPAQPAPLPEPVEAVETVYRPSMGCDLPDCTDPTHFHHCPPDCAEAGHYHDCPMGCADPTHPHCNQCWETSPEEWTCPREDCPLEDCPTEDCPNAHYPHHGGHHRGWRW